jgi:hypothetical protein
MHVESNAAHETSHRLAVAVFVIRALASVFAVRGAFFDYEINYFLNCLNFILFLRILSMN